MHQYAKNWFAENANKQNTVVTANKKITTIIKAEMKLVLR